jgi:Fic family protein
VSDQPTVGWPALEWETDEWSPDPASEYSHRERIIQTGPYQRALPPHIAGARVQLSGDTYAEVEDATTEIVRFDDEVGAETEPYDAVLLRSESAASSKIEHLTASARAIAEAEAEGHGSRNAEEIVANTQTMRRAIELADHINADVILDIHRELLGRHAPTIAGRWRTQQVWIGNGNAGPRIAGFVPPRAEVIPDLVDDLVGFMGRTDMPILALAAIAHAQFETIHPFVDGNGRTGRALVHMILRNRQLTRTATVPVSAGLLTDTAAYVDALDAYRDGQLDPIVSMFSNASLRSVFNSRRLVKDLRNIRSSWNDRVTARTGSGTWAIADLAVHQPVLTTKLIAERLGISANLARALAPLEDAGVLIGNGRRPRTWRAPDILAELDNFAERSGRRREVG